MKKISLALGAVLLSMSAMAEVSYQVVPMPQRIELDACGKWAPLVKGMTVAYPSGNLQMKRNAEFAQEFLGLIPQEQTKKLKAPFSISLGLESENPDAYRITIGKKGVQIQGASESGVFYGIQTLRKSVASEEGDTIRLPWGVVDGEPRFQYRG